VRSFDTDSVRDPGDYGGVLQALLVSPTLSCKGEIWEQYDHMVRTDTVLLPGADAAAIRIKGSEKVIALSCDGNGRYCYLDPYEGGKIAVAEAARNVVCVGAKPLAITNCLNFGNPTKPGVFFQFRQCIEGMADACRVLGTPVTGGNVSFYNENPRGAIDPTPVVGMLGLIDKVDSLCTPHFKKNGDVIALLGECREEIGGSEYLRLIHRLKTGQIPRVDLVRERALENLCLELIGENLVNSAHDCSEGGLAVALAECCISCPGGERGCFIDLEALPGNGEIRTDALLFGESQSRIVVSFPPENLPRIELLARQKGVPCTRLGVVAGDRLTMGKASRAIVDLSVAQLRDEWRKGLSRGKH